MKILIFSVALAWAQSPAHNPKCIPNSIDRFDPGLEFTQGSFKGQCIDSSSVRPPVLIDSVKVANLFYLHQWWTVDLANVEVGEVIYQIVPFESHVPLITAAHTQFRFKLKTPVTLTNQQTSANAKIGDVIVSSTITSPLGVDYSVWKSRSYGIVTRLLATIDRAREEILVDKSVVRQFSLKLSATEKQKLFEVALKRAADQGYTQSYGLLDNNCTTIAFDTLDAMRPTDQPPMRGRWLNIRDEYIQPSLDGLMSRKLIDGQSEIEPLNHEVVCEEATHECRFK